MLDYLMSKLVWIVAAVVLTASILGVFAWQRRSTEELEIEERAEGLKKVINDLCNLESEFKGSVGYQEGGNNTFYLDPTIDEKPFELNFTTAGLFIEQSDERVWEDFIDAVHLYDPYFLGHNTSSILKDVDAVVNSLSLKSGEKFMLETKEFNDVYEVFIYPDGGEEVRKYHDRLGGAIQENISLSWLKDLNETEINKTVNLSMDRPTYFEQDFFLCEDNYTAPYPLSSVHLWEPDSYNFSEEKLKRIDANNTYLSIESSSTIMAQRQLCSVDKNRTVISFIYENSQK